MREITSHRVEGKTDCVRIFPEGDVGIGGGHHQYRLSLGLPGQETGTSVLLKFQNGTIADVGPNGITNESLISVVIDRLQGFQGQGTEIRVMDKPNPCRENAIAITHLETALLWLQKRTRDRIARGVEGTHQK